MLNNLILSAQRIPAQNILRVLFCTSGIGMFVLANLLARKSNGKSKCPISRAELRIFRLSEEGQIGTVLRAARDLFCEKSGGKNFSCRHHKTILLIARKFL